MGSLLTPEEDTAELQIVWKDEANKKDAAIDC